jgi:hypothetical protein
MINRKANNPTIHNLKPVKNMGGDKSVNLPPPHQNATKRRTTSCFRLLPFQLFIPSTETFLLLASVHFFHLKLSISSKSNIVPSQSILFAAHITLNDDTQL